ncbi:hypothetical protein SFC50_02455 [Bacillus infantis]|uniref:hypothetical protein n=1 Tax=Bacillus infantis TaxID=324767 RepID=UPI0039820C27
MMTTIFSYSPGWLVWLMLHFKHPFSKLFTFSFRRKTKKAFEHVWLHSNSYVLKQPKGFMYVLHRKSYQKWIAKEI